MENGIKDERTPCNLSQPDDADYNCGVCESPLIAQEDETRNNYYCPNCGRDKFKKGLKVDKTLDCCKEMIARLDLRINKLLKMRKNITLDMIYLQFVPCDVRRRKKDCP